MRVLWCNLLGVVPCVNLGGGWIKENLFWWKKPEYWFWSIKWFFGSLLVLFWQLQFCIWVFFDSPRISAKHFSCSIRIRFYDWKISKWECECIRIWKYECESINVKIWMWKYECENMNAKKMCKKFDSNVFSPFPKYNFAIKTLYQI